MKGQKIVDEALSGLGLPWSGAAYVADGHEVREPDIAERLEILSANYERISTRRETASSSTVAKWNRGWGEIRTDLETCEFSKDILIPQYYKYDVIPIKNRYYIANDTRLEHLLFCDLRDRVVQYYCGKAREIHEFGCGSLKNLVDISDITKNITLKGYDWSQESENIRERLPYLYRDRIEVETFDMFNPDGAVGGARQESGRVYVTFLAMEQLGDRYTEFLDYIEAKQPDRVIHIEPVVEWYDQGNTHEFFAQIYHWKRDYLMGLYPDLRRRVDEGRAVLEYCWKANFGHRFHTPYNVIVWHPT